MRSRFRGIAVLMLAAIAVGSCVGDQTTQPADQIAVQLKWLHQSQFAGFYAADVNGYYAAEELEVSFIEGGPGIDVYASVLAGEAAFGIDGGVRLSWRGPREQLCAPSQPSTAAAPLSSWRRPIRASPDPRTSLVVPFSCRRAGFPIFAPCWAVWE
ncbi:MAG: hypothetical protein E3J64_05015 [Anaerolineales bacterium]|nr:MAG: hypothetical protein E3J64_05015 [Anaerolineales bacterium]